jgi:hypothetical protein
MRLLLRSLLVTASLLLPATSAAAAPIAHPHGANAIVIRSSSGGGFVPQNAVLGALPAFTLYGDGSVIVPGVVPQIFPGPAISPLVRTTLTERQVQALLLRAKQAGLLGARGIDYGDMGTIGIADAPTTTLRLHAAGRRIVRHAYALGIAPGAGSLTAAQVEARRALASFIDALPRGMAGARYVPRSVAIFVSPYGGQAKPGSNTVTWPLAVPLAGRPANGSSDRCIVVGGQQTRTLLATLKRANQASRWVERVEPGKAYSLIARPLLPNERNCGSLDFG